MWWSILLIFVGVIGIFSGLRYGRKSVFVLSFCTFVLGIAMFLNFAVFQLIGKRGEARRVQESIEAFKLVESKTLPALRYFVEHDDAKDAGPLIAELERQNEWLSQHKDDMFVHDQMRVLQPYDLSWIHFCTPPKESAP